MPEKRRIKNGVCPEATEAFRGAGVYHILAVSGFNVALSEKAGSAHLKALWGRVVTGGTAASSRAVVSVLAWGRNAPEMLVLPKSLKPVGRQLCVAHRVRNVSMAEVRLDAPGVLAPVGEVVAGGVPQHVRMN
jgi:hypothetical protein